MTTLNGLHRMPVILLLPIEGGGQGVVQGPAPVESAERPRVQVRLGEATVQRGNANPFQQHLDEN